MTTIFFWGTRGTHGYMSNWFIAPFVIDGTEFSCVEQFMMYKKAVLFGDTLTSKRILSAKTPGTMKKLGRAVTPYVEEVWRENRFSIVYEGVKAKFSQNPQLLHKLLETGDALLVEASPEDPIWGIAMTATEARKCSPEEWKGENLLGKVLMQVRADLSEDNR